MDRKPTLVQLKPIGVMHTEFPTKFGIPRQSGLVSGLEGEITFLPEYRDPNALRGLSEFSHIWLIWGFSDMQRTEWAATVRPPRLGGNERIGVFASRSPYRPNAIGLSSVKLECIDYTCDNAPVIHVSGADIMDGSPIYDIKPYLPYTDCHADATGGYAEQRKNYALEVHFPERLLDIIPVDKRETLIDVLAQDPRPAYHADPERVYGFEFAGFNVKFTVNGGALSVCAVKPL